VWELIKKIIKYQFKILFLKKNGLIKITLVNYLCFSQWEIFLKKKILNEFNPKLILEIGSKDGVFIKNFSKNMVIGVESCKNLANETRKCGYKTFSDYWTFKLAKKLQNIKKKCYLFCKQYQSY